MAFELPALPYAQDALAPTISAETMEYHYGKHHQTYVDNLNKAVAGTADENASLEDIIMKAEGPLFNNAAQVWNHTFFWNSLSPNGGGQPTGAIADRIAADFGGYDAFRAQITEAGLTQFGSGWAWLVEKDGKLAIMKTPNADLPMKHGAKALFTIDVWEHAYYIDYRNARAKFIEVVLDNLINWDFVNANLAS
ncbi:MAG: superoxide dismutase [Actinobacteria bacterium]|jgi:Fe-Mn family superoxide dismutase|uniref:superoxide dismutase n=1 Tax=freshwater metagenome TaxID=449393 RepID=A0A6J6RJ29_9ZZZZ|nr:superoxide dismutase [Actinomycetota bacterium]MSW32618.1 superoxide dismutase [Fe] [Actinomycetota bacterium]MSX34483.1 superoxide dismutase [Fe] [Actinomycetota bacterium]MSX95022.1 superoxide dismutase [Fe] [Actinomycetota bacterium]MSY25956.1 superoxide dismutase [Fe] [Actinomycetota bacterium]